MTRTDRYAVIVDPYSSGALFAGTFAASDCKVIAVLSCAQPPDVYAASYRAQDFVQVYVAPSGDLQPLASQLREYQPVCVLAGCESGVELAEQLAPLVLPDRANVPQLALARRDKGLMAQAVRDAGVPIMKQICTDHYQAVAHWLAEQHLVGKDLVIKPPKSASTDGVSKLPAGRGLEQAFSKLLHRPNRLGIINDHVLVQEYLSGTEYVVDTFSYGAEHSLCSVCKYTKIANENGMAIYDRMDWVEPDHPATALLVPYAKQVLNALGMAWGNAHIEIMLTDAGPRLIELGARPHGGGHPRLCELATGDSQVKRSVSFFADGRIPPPGYTLRKHMTVVFLRSAKPAVVQNPGLLHSLSSLSSYVDSSIKVVEAQKVPATCDLFATLALGFVVLANEDQTLLERDVQAVHCAQASVFQYYQEAG